MSAALVDGRALRLLGRHVRRGAENHRRRLVIAAGRDRRRVRRRRPTPPTPAPSALARPKSSTFTVPSARTLMLAGFRSRWMIPCSCAASSASAICFAIGSASSSGIGAARDALRRDPRPRRVPSRARATPPPVFEAVDLRDVRMVQRGEHLRFALKRASRSGSLANDVGQHLERDVAIAASCRARDRPRPCRRRRCGAMIS